MKELSSFLVLVGLGYVLYLGFTNVDRLKQVGAVLNGTPDVYKKPEKEPVRPDDPVATARKLFSHIENAESTVILSDTEGGKIWFYRRTHSVTSLLYDVKKTNSLLRPLEAVFSVGHRFYRTPGYDTEDGARASDEVDGSSMREYVFKAHYYWVEHTMSGNYLAGGWELGPVYNQFGKETGKGIIPGYGILKLLPDLMPADR